MKDTTQQIIKEAKEKGFIPEKEDIELVLTMLNGDTDRVKIANYIREYLLTNKQ